MKGLRAARGKDREDGYTERGGVQTAFVELLFEKNGEIFGDILILHSCQSK